LSIDHPISIPIYIPAPFDTPKSLAPTTQVWAKQHAMVKIVLILCVPLYFESLGQVGESSFISVQVSKSKALSRLPVNLMQPSMAVWQLTPVTLGISN